MDRPCLDLYPDQVRALDEACQARGLTYGLAGYSDAKPFTLLGRAGVTVRTVRPDPPAATGMSSFPWLGHIDGYAHPGGFQFVVVEGRPGRDAALPAAVVERLGEPAERVPVGDRILLVYNRPEDWRVRRFADLDLSLLNRRFEQRRASVTYPGATFLNPPGTGAFETPDMVRVFEADPAATKGIAYGPYLSVGRTGRHRVVFRLSAAGDSGPVGYVDVVWTHPSSGESEMLAAVGVYPGDSQEFPIDFYIKPRHLGGQLQFRTSFEGHGRLALHDVRLMRYSHSREVTSLTRSGSGRP